MGDNACKKGPRGKSGFYGTNSGCEKVRLDQPPNCALKEESSLEDLILNPKTNKIPRPPNAFMIYAREHRKLLAMKFPRQNNKNISALLGEAWKNIEVWKKAQYYEKARFLEAMHKKRYPGYTYSPRVARINKQERIKKRKCSKALKDDKQKSPETNEQLADSCDKVEDWTQEDQETKSSCSDYVPNNPQFFESQTLPKICENSSLQYDSEMPSGYPRLPHSWQGTPNETTPLHHPRRYCDEYEIYSRMFSDQPYQRCPPSCSCYYPAPGDHDPFRPASGHMFRSRPESRYPCSTDCNIRETNTSEPKNFAPLSSSYRDVDHQATTPSMEHPTGSSMYHRPVPRYPAPFGQYRDHKPMYYPFPPWNPRGYGPSSCHYRECYRSCCNNYPYPVPSPYTHPHYPGGFFDRSKYATESIGAPPAIESSNHQVYEEQNDAYAESEADTEILNVDQVEEDEEKPLSHETENCVEQVVQEEKIFQQI